MDRYAGPRLPLPALLGAMLAASVLPPAGAQPPRDAAAPRTPTVAAVTYATIAGEPLALDLYLPENVSSPPLLVFIHGGAWQFGSRDNPGALPLLEKGFAIAAVSFRSAQTAPLPAQVHDIKAAIRFLRANADRYGYDGNRIAATGVSSGGHLAALVGLTNGSEAHEGSLGAYPEVSSEVQAIVSWFGAANLTSILAQSTPRGVSIREPALIALLGGPVEERTELAQFGSPVFQVDANDPPLLLLHGDQDPQMPINQSHELHGAAKAAGLIVHFEVIHGAGHGGGAFFDAARTELATEFLEQAFGL